MNKNEKGVVYQYHVEIMGWKENGSVMMDFFKLHIAAFYKEHQGDLDTILNELEGLQKKFIQFGEDGKMKMDAENSNMIPLFLEGKTMDDYEKAYNELMAQECPPFSVKHEIAKDDVEKPLHKMN